MLTCRWKGKKINALDIRNKFNIENYELKKEWKKAQANNELTCEECGHPVILKAGTQKTPHFAHMAGTLVKCNYSQESEEHRLAKSVLYNYFRNKYPELK